MSTLRRTLLLTIALALAYLAAARMGAWAASGPNRISALWPACGIALAALMLRGLRAVPGLAIGMFLSNLDAFMVPIAGLGLGPASALGAAAMTGADLLQAGLAARVLADFPQRVREHPVQQTLRFALTVAVACVLSSTMAALVLAALNASLRAELVFGWTTWWVGDVTGMLVVTPALLMLLHPRLREDRLSIQAFPLMTLGLGLTLFSTFAVGIADRDAHIERFSADAGRLAMTLENHVELTGRDLETLQQSFTRQDTEPAEFRAVSTPLLVRSPWQSTFSWLPRVAKAQRDTFETAADGLDGISIREVQADGSVVRAGVREEHFPVLWTDPQSGREALIGLDDGADPNRGAALEHARVSSRMSATPPLSTVANSPDGRVVQTFYLPVRDRLGSVSRSLDPLQVRGFVGATMDLAAMLQIALTQMGIHDQTVLLYDPDSPGSVALQWSDREGLLVVDAKARDALIAQLASGVFRRHWLPVGDRRWGLLSQPDWASTMPTPGWLQLAVLCGGLAFTALLTGFMVVRRRRDEVLQGAREQLEEQVLARTQDLAATNRLLREEVDDHRRTEELLQEARRHAESANRAKSLFLANMSHEIRTPLNAVLGYTQLLIEDRRQTPEGRERLRIIYSAGQRLLGLINDVLDLAKIEAGGLQVHLEPIALRRELAEIESLFAPRAAAKGLALRAEVDLDDDAALLADRAKFGQVVLNLLGNALKFTDAGHIVLRAWRSGGDTLVEVEDTGPGMDASELAGVFTPFRQGQAGFDKGGTGLGLTLSRNIAEALGGELTLASERGVGTRVRLRLPMAVADVRAAPAAHYHGGRRLAPGTTLRVLVVEDDAHSRDVLVTLLRDAGCDVTAAVDGQAGLEACLVDTGAASAPPPGAPPFAIVFSDIRMPRMDGLQMLHLLRADPRTHDLPLIAVSASSLEHERRYYISEGFQDFVGKPYDFESIYAMLAQHAHAALVDVPEEAFDAAPADEVAGPRDVAEAGIAAGSPAVAVAAARAQLDALAQGAASGSVSKVREALAALAALGQHALPAGAHAQLEADLRLYDFSAIESRTTELLEELQATEGVDR